MNYQEYLNSPHWQRLRVRILKRDGYKCTQCNETKELDVHHLSYDRLGQERDEDVATLCRRCHNDEYYYQGCIEPTEKMIAKQISVTQVEYQDKKQKIIAGLEKG